MRKILTVLALVVSCTAFAQEYSFDYLISSNQRKVSDRFSLSPQPGTGAKKKWKQSHLVNCKTSDYDLLFFLDAYGTKNTTARIYHESAGRSHLYKLIPNQDRELGLALSYEGTRISDLKTFPEEKITVRKLDDLIFEITSGINELDSYKLTVLLEESSDDLTGSIRLDIPDYIEQQMITTLKSNLDPLKNYSINEYIIQYSPKTVWYVRTLATKLKYPVRVNIEDKKRL